MKQSPAYLFFVALLLPAASFAFETRFFGSQNVSIGEYIWLSQFEAPCEIDYVVTLDESNLDARISLFIVDKDNHDLIQRGQGSSAKYKSSCSVVNSVQPKVDDCLLENEEEYFAYLYNPGPVPSSVKYTFGTELVFVNPFAVALFVLLPVMLCCFLGYFFYERRKVWLLSALSRGHHSGSNVPSPRPFSSPLQPHHFL
eukprot:TRINITY_DN7042_c0_g1_i2.p1 TRINITY_DN7042_c0_g1~~TRINITY_DN7042_c0_g1_i2.p1  ORF type:complete len:199 (-),score=33.54 TRINITY_DN7042_c0_g1_i2:344-940(-)